MRPIFWYAAILVIGQGYRIDPGGNDLEVNKARLDCGFRKDVCGALSQNIESLYIDQVHIVFSTDFTKLTKIVLLAGPN